MVPTPTKQKALALAPKKLHINRTWDCEYDIHSHLHKKNRVLKSETEKSNYFNTLLKDIEVKGLKGDPVLLQFMNDLYCIVQSHKLHLDEDPNIENTDEENGTDDDDDVMVDPQHKYFMDHVRPHGKSYVLDIPEDGVYVKYEPDYANHVSNEEVNVCIDTDKRVNAPAKCKSHKANRNHVKRRVRKPKGAKLSAVMNGNTKGSDVSHLTGSSRRSKRLKIPPDSATLVIDDSDDAAEDMTSSARCQIVEHGWTLFKEKLMAELKAPYCEEEHKRLLHNITVRKPVQNHRDLRGGIKIYEKPDLGKSFLDHHVDLAKKIEAACDYHPRVLSLLRGFFYWLKNLSHDGSFPPWTDQSCLDVLPQQSEG